MKQTAAYVELLDHLGIDSVFVIGNSAGGPSLYHFAHDYPGRCRGMILQLSVVTGGTKPLPPRFLMKPVFGSDFIYWSSVRLFGKSMSGMFHSEGGLQLPVRGGEEDADIENLSLLTADLCKNERHPV